MKQPQQTIRVVALDPTQVSATAEAIDRAHAALANKIEKGPTT